MSEYPFQRRLGAFPLRNGRTEFRVWAQKPDAVLLRLSGTDHPLEHVGFDIYEATVDAGTGSDYEFVLDGTPLPDPCSRWQPDGLRGPVAGLRPARPRLDRPATSAPPACTTR